jgi:hypothetical protein
MEAKRKPLVEVGAGLRVLVVQEDLRGKVG